MGRTTVAGGLILGLIAIGLLRGGETRSPTPLLAVSSSASTANSALPRPVALTPTASPPQTARSLFAEPTVNSYRGEPPAAAKPIRRSLYVRGKDVPMRASPDAKAKILNRLPNGMEVGELSRREGWVEIRHPISAIEGWVSARRLGEAAPEAKETRTEEQPKPKKREPSGIELLSDAAVIARLIALDAAAYSGNCRCPENHDRAGRRCGARSAHSRAGGWAPLCYPSDVSREAIVAFRANGGR